MKRYIRLLPPYLPTMIVVVAICYLSLASNPIPNQPSFLNFPGADKVVHFLMYWGLTVTFCFDYYRRASLQYERAMLAAGVLLAIALGGAIEILQTTMGAGRSGDWLDFAADATGAFIGIVVGRSMWQSLHRPNSL